MRLVFLHGAGGFVEDRPLAEGLGNALGASVDVPRLPEEDMAVSAWAAPIREGIAGLRPGDLLVAHSFGASILLHVLAEGRRVRAPVVLLAMPDWTPAGWEVTDYVFPTPLPASSLSLHHCRDDDVVPFEHLALNAARLPSARVCEHASGGHQFDGLIEVIARDDRATP